MGRSYILIAVLLILSSCSRQILPYDSCKVILPETVSLSQDDVSFLTLKSAKNSEKNIEILIYYYTSGIEVIKYTENNEIIRKLKDGKLHALVKYRVKGSVVKVQFLELKAPGKKALLEALKKELRTLFRKTGT